MNQSIEKTHVVISGVSIASLILGISLAQEDISHIIVDTRSQEEENDQEMILLYPGTQSLLKKLDIREILEEHMEELSSIHFLGYTSSKYIHSIRYTSELEAPVAVEKKRLKEALLLILEDYGIVPRW